MKNLYNFNGTTRSTARAALRPAMKKLAKLMPAFALASMLIGAASCRTATENEALTLERAKGAAVAELNGYVDLNDYYGDLSGYGNYDGQKKQIQDLIAAGRSAIYKANSLSEVNAALAEYKAKIDLVPTKEQSDLYAARASAINRLKGDGYMIPGYAAPQQCYDDAEWQTIQGIIAAGTAAINNAASSDEINRLLGEYQAQIDNVEMKAAENIEFDPPPQAWCDNPFVKKEVDRSLDAYLRKLENQSLVLHYKCQFKHNPNDSQNYINFVNRWNSVQTYIYSVMGRDNINAILPNVSYDLKCLIDDRMSLLADNHDLFKAQANAFREAHTLEQRKFYGYQNGVRDKIPGEERTKKDAFMAQLVNLGITAEDIPDAIRQLDTAIKDAMPEEVKKYAGDIMQQWEDFAQFDGYIQDVLTTGQGINNISRTQQQTRAQVQAAQ